MKLLLDTDVCIYLIKAKSKAIVERLVGYEVGDVGLSSITVAELCFGVANSSSIDRNREALKHFLVPFTVAPFGPDAAFVYGRVRTELQRTGEPIGPLDTLIGAHALALDVALATNNVREFSRVPGLEVQRWTGRS